jgi:hypothetical protein
MLGREAFDPGFGASAGLSEAAQWPRLDRPEPRLQAAWHDNIVCGTRSRHRKNHRGSFKTTSPRRVSRLHEQRHRGLSGPKASRHPRQPRHPQEKRTLAQGPPQRAISFHADKCVPGSIRSMYGFRSCRGSRLTGPRPRWPPIPCLPRQKRDKVLQGHIRGATT